jgi:hypothetical protein
MITQRTKNNIAKFVTDYNKTVAEVSGQQSKDSALAEDCTTFYTLDITILKTKIKVATTYTGYGGKTYHDDITDEDDAREYLAKWRADMRRARRYWSMDCDTIDKMQDGVIEDVEED